MENSITLSLVFSEVLRVHFWRTCLQKLNLRLLKVMPAHRT